MDKEKEEEEEEEEDKVTKTNQSLFPTQQQFLHNINSSYSTQD